MWCHCDGSRPLTLDTSRLQTVASNTSLLMGLGDVIMYDSDLMISGGVLGMAFIGGYHTGSDLTSGWSWVGTCIFDYWHDAVVFRVVAWNTMVSCFDTAYN